MPATLRRYAAGHQGGARLPGARGSYSFPCGVATLHGACGAYRRAIPTGQPRARHFTLAIKSRTQTPQVDVKGGFALLAEHAVRVLGGRVEPLHSEWLQRRDAAAARSLLAGHVRDSTRQYPVSPAAAAARRCALVPVSVSC